MTVKTKRARLLALTEEGKACQCFTVGKVYTGLLAYSLTRLLAYSTLTPALCT